MASKNSVPKFPENIGGAQLLAAPNIGGARAPLPPPPVPTALGSGLFCVLNIECLGLNLHIAIAWRLEVD